MKERGGGLDEEKREGATVTERATMAGRQSRITKLAFVLVFVLARRPVYFSPTTAQYTNVILKSGCIIINAALTPPNNKTFNQAL